MPQKDLPNREGLFSCQKSGGGKFITQKFSLGRVVVTRGIHELLDRSAIAVLLTRHASGDWGDLCEEDKALNDAALLFGQNRIFSSYRTPLGKVWIITEYDLSVTTVLLPAEY